MKSIQDSNKKKLILAKEKIATLSEKDMQNIAAGGGGSTNHDFTCTWCAGTVTTTVTIIKTK